MKILVTGGTGYIGSNILRRLLQNGHQAVGLARSDEAALKLRSLGTSAVFGDLGDFPKLKDAVMSSDGVVHAGFGHDDWKEMEASFIRARDAVAAMLDALSGTKKPFVYTSGAGVFQDTGRSLAVESSTANAPYPVSPRTETEQLVVAGAAQGIRTAVIRCGLVYGRGGGAIMQLLLGLARNPEDPMAVGDGKNVWSAVHMDDLVDLYALVLEKGSPGEIYHAANGEAYTFEDIATAASKASGKAHPVRAMPVEIARQNIGLLVDELVSNKRLSAQKAYETLGWKPVRPSIISEIELGSYAISPPDTLTMINRFEVPGPATEQFLKDWHTDLNFMHRQAGNMGGALYKSTSDSESHRYVNVAKWDTVKSFEAARSNMLQRFKTEDTDRGQRWERLEIRMNPCTYTTHVVF